MAASRSLGVLTLDLVAKIGGFVRGMDQAERKAASSLKGIERRMSGFANVAKGLFAGFVGAFSVDALVSGFTKIVDQMDQVRDASIRLGIGTETLSAFGFAAKQTGTDIDALGKGLKILAKNAADALNPKSAKADIFKALGVDVADASGQLKQLDTLVFELADKIGSLEDGTQKAALMLELFGKTGLDLTEFFKDGSAGIKELTDRARELGVTIGEDAANKADAFNDTMNELRAAATGLGIDIATELLPQLTEMVGSARDWVKDGDNAKTVTQEITSAIHDLAGALGAVRDGLGALDSLKDGLTKLQQFLIDWSPGTSIRKKIQEAIWGQSGDWDLNGFVANQRQGPIPSTPIDGMFSIPGVTPRQPFSAVPTVGNFSTRSGGGIDRNALNRALSGATDKGSKKTGKSDAEKEAERIAKAIKEMTEAQREWQAELDGTGNKIADDYARRLAEITKQAEEFAEKGVPKEKIAAFREEMTKLAAGIKAKETAEYLQDFRRQTEDMVASATGASMATIEYARAIEDLNEELAEGIITQADFSARADAEAQKRDAAANQVLADIAAQRDLLGQTAEYQDTYNKLAYAGVDANSALGQAIIDANAELHAQMRLVEDQIGMFDAFRDATRGVFDDLKEGVGVWDALKAGVDRFADALFDIIVNNLVERALGQQGTASTGSAGGWLGTVAGWLFGSMGGGSGGTGASSGSFVGPRAIGGGVYPGGMYEVNERGPELAVFGGRTYLMVGAQAGVVKPLRETASPRTGGDTYNFNFAGADEQRTRDQAAAVHDDIQRRNRARNGVR